MIHSVQRMNAEKLMDEAAAAHPGQLLRLGFFCIHENIWSFIEGGSETTHSA